jgi:PAS domain S-box-containing protein
MGLAIDNARLAAAAEAARQRVAKLLEQIADGFIAFDAGWRYTYVNARAGELLGRRPTDLIGKHYWTESPEAADQPFARACRRAMAEQTVIQSEDYYASWDRWFESRIYPSPDGLAIFLQEITERKRLERALEEHHRLLQGIVESTTDAVFVKDRQGRYRLVNSVAARILGRPAAQIIGRDDRDLLPPAIAAEIRATDQRIMASGEPAVVEEQVPEAGAMRTFLSTKTVLRGADGAVAGLIGIAKDITERTRAAAALRASEQHLRDMLDSLFVFVGVLTPDGTLIQVNRAALDVAALAPEAVLGKPLEQTYWLAYDPAVQARLRAAIERAAGGEASRFDLPVRVAEERFITIDFMLAPMRDAQGRITHLIPSAVDITERKQAEAALQQAHAELEQRVAERTAELARANAALVESLAERQRTTERLAFLAEAGRRLAGSLDLATTLASIARLAVPALGDACFVDLLDDDQRVQRVEVAVADPAQAALAAALRRYPPSVANPHSRIGQALRTGQPLLLADVTDDLLQMIAIDAEHLRLLRALAPTAIIIAPLVTNEQRRGALTFVTVAASGRRYGPDDLALAEALAEHAALAADNARLFDQSQAALAREQAAHAETARLAAERAAILSHLGDGVVVADQTGRVTLINDTARRFGLPLAPGAPVGTDLARPAVLSLDQQPYAPVDLPLARAVLRGETVVGAELQVRQADGSERTLLASAVPVVAEDGRRLGGVLTVRDVTAQRAFERRRDEFFAGVSHDLRTPLTAIKASIDVVLANEPPATPAPIHRLLVNIDEAATRMTTLVNNLLDLFRLRAGRTPLRRAPHDLRALVQRAGQAIEPLARARGQRVTVELPPEPLVAPVDAGHIDRVLLNLLSNAHKYGRDGGAIRLALAVRPDAAVITVADDGPGIPLAEQAHLFERFYRSEREAVQRQQGSGLGLAIAHALVELHGGRLWVESAPGAGAAFHVALPLQPAGPAGGEGELD